MKFDMQSLLEQAKKMQSEMENIKNVVAQKTVVGDSGGGMVVVTMNGANKVLSVKIAKEIVNPDDIQMLEDLVVAAVNRASDNAASMVQSEMSKMTSGLPNIPGLNLGF